MGVRNEYLERLKAIRLSEDQIAEVLSIVCELENEVAVLTKRRERDREAKRIEREARRYPSSNPLILKKSAESADIGGQALKERKWTAMLERWEAGSWPYRTPQPGMSGCEIPEAFIQNFRATRGASISHETLSTEINVE